ncbi:hypothetical protein ACP6PL_28265 [Dapis sp. BLCC M126]
MSQPKKPSKKQPATIAATREDCGIGEEYMELDLLELEEVVGGWVSWWHDAVEIKKREIISNTHG